MLTKYPRSNTALFPETFQRPRMRSSKLLHPTCSSSQCSDSPGFQLQGLSGRKSHKANRGLVDGDGSNFGSGLSGPCLCYGSAALDGQHLGLVSRLEPENVSKSCSRQFCRSFHACASPQACTVPKVVRGTSSTVWPALRCMFLGGPCLCLWLWPNTPFL